MEKKVEKGNTFSQRVIRNILEALRMTTLMDREKFKQKMTRK